MENPYGCEICKKSFAFPVLLKQHMTTHSDQFKFYCQLCPAGFATKEHLVYHAHSHSSERPFECETCGKAFKQVAHLNVHNKIHTGERKYECSLCYKRFISNAKLKLHQRVHTGEATYQCGFCGKSFTTGYNLRAHQARVHEKVKTHQCTDCDKVFFSIMELRNHRNLHTGERPYKCNECGKAFKKSSALGMHKTRHLSYKGFDCDICGVDFKLKSALKNHANTHKDNTYECDVCDRVFNRIMDLKRHKSRMHPDSLTSSYQCNNCKNSFQLKSSLKQHESNHFTTIGDYSCEKCERQYKTQRSLNNHKRTHKGAKYKCHKCNKEFHLKSNLDDHLVRHLTDKPFGCQFCSSSFKQSSDLRNHLRMHQYRRQTFSCSFCTLTFNLPTHLASHVRNLHPNLDVCHSEISADLLAEETCSEIDSAEREICMFDNDDKIYGINSDSDMSLFSQHSNSSIKSSEIRNRQMTSRTDEKASVTFLFFGKLEGQQKCNHDGNGEKNGGNRRSNASNEQFEIWDNGAGRNNLRTFKSNRSLSSSINMTSNGNIAALSEVSGYTNQAENIDFQRNRNGTTDLNDSSRHQMIDLPKLSNYADTDNLLSWPSPQHINLLEHFDSSCEMDLSESFDDHHLNNNKDLRGSKKFFRSRRKYFGCPSLNTSNAVETGISNSQVNNDQGQMERKETIPDIVIHDHDLDLNLTEDTNTDLEELNYSSDVIEEMLGNKALKDRMTRSSNTGLGLVPEHNGRRVDEHANQTNQTHAIHFCEPISDVISSNLDDMTKKIKDESRKTGSSTLNTVTMTNNSYGRPLVQEQHTTDTTGVMGEQNKDKSYFWPKQSLNTEKFSKNNMKREIISQNMTGNAGQNLFQFLTIQPKKDCVLVTVDTSNQSDKVKDHDEILKRRDDHDSDVKLKQMKRKGKYLNVSLFVAKPISGYNSSLEQLSSEDSYIGNNTTISDIIICNNDDETVTTSQDSDYETIATIHSQDSDAETRATSQDGDDETIATSQDSDNETIATSQDRDVEIIANSQDSDVETIATSQDGDNETIANIQDSDVETIATSQDGDNETIANSQDGDNETIANIQDSDVETIAISQDSDVETIATSQDSDNETIATSQDSDVDSILDSYSADESTIGDNSIETCSTLSRIDTDVDTDYDDCRLEDENSMTDNCSSLETDDEIEFKIPYQKSHTQECLKKKDLWLKRNCKFKRNNFRSRNSLSYLVYKKIYSDLNKLTIRPNVSKIGRKYVKNRYMTEEKIAGIRDVIKKKYSQIADYASDASNVKLGDNEKLRILKSDRVNYSSTVSTVKLYENEKSGILKSDRLNYSIDVSTIKLDDKFRSYETCVSAGHNSNVPVFGIASPRYKTRYAHLRKMEKTARQKYGDNDILTGATLVKSHLNVQFNKISSSGYKTRSAKLRLVAAADDGKNSKKSEKEKDGHELNPAQLNSANKMGDSQLITRKSSFSEVKITSNRTNIKSNKTCSNIPTQLETITQSTITNMSCSVVQPDVVSNGNKSKKQTQKNELEPPSETQTQLSVRPVVLQSKVNSKMESQKQKIGQRRERSEITKKIVTNMTREMENMTPSTMVENMTPSKMTNITSGKMANMKPRKMENMTPRKMANITPRKMAENITPNTMANMTPSKMANLTPNKMANMKPRKMENMTTRKMTNMTPSKMAKNMTPRKMVEYMTPRKMANMTSDKMENMTRSKIAETMTPSNNVLPTKIESDISVDIFGITSEHERGTRLNITERPTRSSTKKRAEVELKHLDQSKIVEENHRGRPNSNQTSNTRTATDVKTSKEVKGNTKQYSGKTNVYCERSVRLRQVNNKIKASNAPSCKNGTQKEVTDLSKEVTSNSKQYETKVISKRRVRQSKVNDKIKTSNNILSCDNITPKEVSDVSKEIKGNSNQYKTNVIAEHNVRLSKVNKKVKASNTPDCSNATLKQVTDLSTHIDPSIIGKDISSTEIEEMHLETERKRECKTVDLNKEIKQLQHNGTVCITKKRTLKQNDLPCGKYRIKDSCHDDSEIKYSQNPQNNIPENTELEMNNETKQKTISKVSPKENIIKQTQSNKTKAKKRRKVQKNRYGKEKCKKTDNRNKVDLILHSDNNEL